MGLNVLVIDDNSTSIYILKRILFKTGYDIELFTAVEGEEALGFLQNEEQTYPDLIFVDINMPQMDGWEFIEGYVINSFDLNPTVIYMLSASDRENDIFKVKSIDCVAGYLVKYPTVDEMKELIDRHFK